MRKHADNADGADFHGFPWKNACKLRRFAATCAATTISSGVCRVLLRRLSALAFGVPTGMISPLPKLTGLLREGDAIDARGEMSNTALKIQTTLPET